MAASTDTTKKEYLPPVPAGEEPPAPKAGDAKDKDKDLEPIHYSEDFRRAKRNALLWAGLTVLAALGHVSEQTSEVDVRTPIGNFAFAPWLLVGMSLIVLVFMFLGYIRAERRLLAKHSEFEVAARYAEVGDVAEQLKQMLTELTDLAERIEGRYKPVFSKDIESSDILKKEIAAITDKYVLKFSDWGVSPCHT